ncbi:meiosis regulator and mRNA stability factor 1 [Copidosoma floridanum]|uniref:meiosis regulator and mRNA stability factor 1 n=1 Tax=Copidosoma floridanum TaxID=29053 RepID=UPI0006C9CAEF|nr:meiosis regulator and mRNA stability factor 1 [Copidosoma floridanum]
MENLEESKLAGGDQSQKKDCTADLLPKMLFQGDAAVVAAAAAAAAVKFTSNYLPPIGVFWDIENCQVPKGRSAMAVTRVIRDKFFNGYKEAEFIVVCDVQKENKLIIDELNDAQVNLIHVSATCKNAADEKLRQSIRRFADTHGSPAAIILISGDINFAADLSDLRHRKKIHVILLHKENTSEALILCADDHYDFTQLFQSLPSRTPMKMGESYDLLVSNLPEDKEAMGIKRRLKQLSYNCGGRVVQIRQSSAVVRFSNKETADRAQKRMHGEYVFDSKISVRYLKEKERDLCTDSRDQGSNGNVREGTTSESEVVGENTNEMYGVANAISGTRSLPGTPHYPTSSPIVGNYSSWNGMYYTPQGGVFPPPPAFVMGYLPNDPARSYAERVRSQSPQMWPMSNPQQQQQLYRYWDDRSKAREFSTPETSNFRTVKGPLPARNVQYPQQSDWNPPRPPWSANTSNNSILNFSTHKLRTPSPMFAPASQDGNHWNGQQGHSGGNRKRDRTPSPYEAMSTLPGSVKRSDHVSPFRQSNSESEEVENFFSPISSRNSNGVVNGNCTPIELQVTNLDQNIDPKDMRRYLSSLFMEHVMVLQISITVHSDGNFAATVKVPSLSEAQYAISQLHRRKVGHKRILISYVHTSGPNPQIIRAQIVMLLQEVPEHKLPLFKFREMFESRFMVSIGMSELYKMKDVCVITDDPSGRMVSLNPDHRNTPSPNLNTTLDGQSLELPYCTIHAQKPWVNKGWAEQEMASLPNVKISLKLLSERVHQLLSTHSEILPLMSFPCCYNAEFNEPLEIDENGVPLEQLISCLPTVEIKQGLGCGKKHIVWATNKEQDDNPDENKRSSSPLANQLAFFSRELVDLLKTAPHCQLSFNRLIPAYHHHFGRQCRVADYGFTKLIDLLEALSNTVLVMGEGNKRIVTLSHRAQVRRFTSDLLRVLKAQASKQVTLTEFPGVYARVIGKPWDIADYGVCNIDDILGEVSENIVVVTGSKDGKDRVISIPKREQTGDEIERTKQFAAEVVELLKHAPQQRMLFNKFVPSYHHHFGHQCRVSDYGFTKLIELFEAIPEIIKIEEGNGEDRKIFLTEKEGIHVLGEQMSKLISRYADSNGQLMISSIAKVFLEDFGYALHPELFNCSSILHLMEKLHGYVKIVNTKNGVAVVSIDKNHIQQLGLECRRVLMDAADNRMPFGEFEQCYEKFFNKKCMIEKYSHSLESFVKISNENNDRFIELTPIQRFACDVQRVLIAHNGKINMSQFEAAYLKVIGAACRSAQYGYSTLYAALRAIPCTVIVKDIRHRKKVIHLNRKLSAIGLLPKTYASTYQDTDSSNDSIENGYYSNSVELTNSVPVVTNSNVPVLNENSKWNAISQQSAWSKDQNTWESKLSHWTIPNNKNKTDEPREWFGLESRSNNFFENLEKVGSTFPPPPPKPDSPEDSHNKMSCWQSSSIWSSPPKFDMPPLTLSPLKQMSGIEASDLISPTKSLLPATANPFNPRVSPFFSSKHNVVVAPHPSELPLPSLSFTPKKTASPQEQDSAIVTSENSASFSSSPITSRDNSNKENSSIEQNNSIDTTPTKRSFHGKCRLAAQFNQLPFDS